MGMPDPKEWADAVHCLTAPATRTLRDATDEELDAELRRRKHARINKAQQALCALKNLEEAREAIRASQWARDLLAEEK